MKKNLNGKKLSLNVETLRDLSPEEMTEIKGGRPWYCWTVVVPSSGIFTTIPITRGDC